MTSNGKGDKRRPLSVSRKQFDNNWDYIRWTDSKKIDKFNPNKVKTKKK